MERGMERPRIKPKLVDDPVEVEKPSAVIDEDTKLKPSKLPEVR